MTPHRIYERLDTQPVTYKKKLSFAIIPEAKSKHTLDPRYQPLNSPPPVPVNEHLGIGLALEFIALRLKVHAKVSKVINSSIKDNSDRMIRRKHRLASGGAEIEDRQAP